MIVGMSVVFVFLYLLVWLMRLQAAVLSRIFPESATAASPSSPEGEGEEEEDGEEERRIVAAISAAVREYRRTREG